MVEGSQKAFTFFRRRGRALETEPNTQTSVSECYTYPLQYIHTDA